MLYCNTLRHLLRLRTTYRWSLRSYEHRYSGLHYERIRSYSLAVSTLSKKLPTLSSALTWAFVRSLGPRHESVRWLLTVSCYDEPKKETKSRNFGTEHFLRAPWREKVVTDWRNPKYGRFVRFWRRTDRLCVLNRSMCVRASEWMTSMDLHSDLVAILHLNPNVQHRRLVGLRGAIIASRAL